MRFQNQVLPRSPDQEQGHIDQDVHLKKIEKIR